ncbi:G-protein-signaling modulator 2 isoform X2 [Chrysoperla carnea]|uniref:G-protein-signaling modulator 2 isoform X2 n=1 Tax=Chrysoperla carnea TaxID=189513 RepID=UPI001D081F1B|nr:G-protein-signaling modulator 2 isoform X2 [Chrysoperla carnea]
MSLSASAENLTSETQNFDGGASSMCLELALEGERLCKSGDCRAGVAFLQAAIQAGTDDLRTLSAIYSQLGNAYFYLGDYVKAMQYHKHDLTLARTMGDKLGEAKSSGNLGNTLKVMGKFDEAMICCKRHLEISRELGDRLSEGRALYNLGNVYHAKGKHIGRVGQQDPGEFPEDVKSCLQQAVTYYEENLALMCELNDVAAQGRACGNLGNTHYLLGDFEKAIHYHEKRLTIARQFGDKAAERRANSNLGNSHIFLGQFESAAQHYKRTLILAQELGDKAVEAQACYSLGNTYTLLRDYQAAIEYHLRHLLIAQHLQDRVGEGRACWSLGNAHAALQNHEKALYFATKHLEISDELGDSMGQATAKMNIADLRKVLGLPQDEPIDGATCEDFANDHKVNLSFNGMEVASSNASSSESSSIQNHRLHRLTPDGKQRSQLSSTSALPTVSSTATQPSTVTTTKPTKVDDEESFFDLLSRFQSKRMDDQRCSLQLNDNKENRNGINLVQPSTAPAPGKKTNHNNNETTNGVNDGRDDLLEMIVGMQSKRMDEQRVELTHLPGLQPSSLQRLTAVAEPAPNTPDDAFLEMIMRCQGSRLEEQRSTLPEVVDTESEHQPHGTPSIRGATVPDEDFFSLIMRFQSGRMEDQRATVPKPEPKQNNDVNGGPTASSSGKNKK